MEQSEYKKIIKEYFKDNQDVVAVYLYGSFAKGLEKNTSDIDIAIIIKEPETDRKSLLTSFVYESDLSAEFGRKVEVKILNTSSLSFVHRVLREGEMIESNDNKRRVVFEENAIKKYFDMKPLFEEYYKSLSDIAGKGELHVRYT